MFQYGGEIENFDFDKGNDANVGLFGMSFFFDIKLLVS